MLFKDVSEVRNYSLQMGRPELFEEIVGSAIERAIKEMGQPQGEDDLSKPDSAPISPEPDLNRYLPVYTVGQIKERSEGSQEEGWYCPLLMKKGEITLFGGEAKRSGKTTLYMHALKATHDGTPFFGMPTIPTRSLILTEQGNNILEATTKAGIQDDDGIFISPFKDVSREKWTTLIEKAVDTCKARDIGILVIDTFTAFARLRGSDENLSGEILERMVPIIEAARVHDLHVSLLHHTGKDGEIRGSSAFAQEPDIIWVLKRPPGDHSPNVRALEGLGRHDAVNTTFNIALESEGYVVLGTNGQIENRKARGALMEATPIGKANAKRRKEVLDSLSDVTSMSTLQRALEDLIEARAIHEETVKGKGNPKVLWRPQGKAIKEDETEEDLFKSNPRSIGSESDSNKSRIEESAYLWQRDVESFKSDPIATADQLMQILECINETDTVALDLETMPPDGWIWEVASSYRDWRKGLKNKPKPDRMQAQWDKLKDKVYKKYAVNPETAQVRLVSLATQEGLNETVDATHVDVSPLLDALKRKTLITHNGSFDLGVLRERYGYVHEGRVLDTELLYILHHYAEDGTRSVIRDGKKRLPDPTKIKVKVNGKQVGMTSLAAVANRYLPGIKLDKAQQREDWSIPNLPVEMMAYSLKDSKVLLDLAQVLMSRLQTIGMSDIVDDIESRATPAKVWMERNGIPADKLVAKEMGAKYGEEASKALERLTDLLEGVSSPDGEPWSWTKSNHVLAALESLGVDLDELDRTGKTEAPSTSKDSLNKISGPDTAVEWVKTYLHYQNLRKRSSDFVNKYAELVRDNGTIIGRFDTVSTGRYNCTKPNLQQVPSRGELQTVEGMRIRDIFRARPGESLVVADFEQVELLLAATIAERRSDTKSKMLDVFRAEDSDIHRATAAWVLGKPEKDITKAERTLAKALNFGLIYGCSAEKLLEVAVNDYGIKDMKLKDAKKYRKAFFEKYPEFVAWHKKVSADCDNGIEYATTPRGRRRKLPKWDKSGDVAFTTAVNHPVQGAGADAIKLTLAKLFEDRHNCPGNPELNCTVHDEVILSVEAEHAESAKAWVEKHMADAEREAVMDLESPIAVDVKSKESWGG